MKRSAPYYGNTRENWYKECEHPYTGQLKHLYYKKVKAYTCVFTESGSSNDSFYGQRGGNSNQHRNGSRGKKKKLKLIK